MNKLFFAFAVLSALNLSASEYGALSPKARGKAKRATNLKKESAQMKDKLKTRKLNKAERADLTAKIAAQRKEIDKIKSNA